MAIVNIAAYQFAPLEDLQPLRARLLALCMEQGLRGTILLSVEGINLFVAGSAEGVELLLEMVRSLPGFADMQPKYSESEEQPFNRMLVRIKREIIAFGVEGIDPARRTSPKLPARVLKQWLDEGREVVLLDTRNDYEVKLGTFHNALPIGIGKFRDFPDAVDRLPEAMKEKTIVMFCTGGIRCEKAGPLMERKGFKTIHQLEGGILKYFEECGPAHYEGECFVFDQRVGVDPQLEETTSAQCFVCMEPLTEEDQASEKYVPEVSCPHCYRDPAEEMRQQILQRQARLLEVTNPLPGSVACDNYRPLKFSDEQDGMTLLEALVAKFPQVEPEKWEASIKAGRLLGTDHKPLAAHSVVRGGRRLLHLVPSDIEPAVNPSITILHEDEAIILLNKPAPLPMHPCGRFNRNTLQHILAEVYHPQRPRPAHRLDANTTGLVVVCRMRRFASVVQQEFAAGGVEKSYLVRVVGHPIEDDFTCEAALSDAPGPGGSRNIDEAEGRPARTLFRVLRRLDDGSALLEARPVTGRTNQIRIHLWLLGYPVQGEATYLPGGEIAHRQTLEAGEAPLCLHSWKLAFTHPISGKRMEACAPLPDWAGELEMEEAAAASVC